MLHSSCKIGLIFTRTESYLIIFGMQLHHQILVRASHVKMEERVFPRALISFAPVQLTTLGLHVNNVRMFRRNFLQGIQKSNVFPIMLMCAYFCFTDPIHLLLFFIYTYFTDPFRLLLFLIQVWLS